MQEASLPSALSWLSCLGRPTADTRDVWGGVEVRKHAGNVLIPLLAALPRLLPQHALWFCLSLCTHTHM